MPFLEAELGPGVAEGLARTATLLGADADYLDAEAERVYESIVWRRFAEDGVSTSLRTAEPSGERTAEAPGAALHAVVLPAGPLRGLPTALRGRVIARAVTELGGQPTFERLAAVERLLDRRGSAGPVEVPGHVSAYRQTSSAAAKAGARTGAGPVHGQGGLVLVSHR